MSEGDSNPGSENEEPSNFPHRDVKYCPRCDVPVCYCRFFGHGANEGENNENEKEGHESGPKKKGGKNSGEKREVIVSVNQRTKKKRTTVISHLDDWDIDLKDFSKHVSKKLALGCSTTNGPTGQEIVIQGDAGDQIIEMLLHEFSIPKNSIKAVRKMKKVVIPQPAAQPEFHDMPDDENGEGNDEHDGEEDEEEDDILVNPNRMPKKQKQKQQQQQQQQHQQQNHNNEDNDHQQHKGGNFRGGFHGGKKGNRGNRGGHNRGRGGHHK